MTYKLGFIQEPHPFPEWFQEFVLPEELKLVGEDGWKAPQFYTHKVPPPVGLVVETDGTWDIMMDALMLIVICGG